MTDVQSNSPAGADPAARSQTAAGADPTVGTDAENATTGRRSKTPTVVPPGAVSQGAAPPSAASPAAQGGVPASSTANAKTAAPSAASSTASTDARPAKSAPADGASETPHAGRPQTRIKPAAASPSHVVPPPGNAPPPAASSGASVAETTRRVRARWARRITGQRNTGLSTRTVVEPLLAAHRELHPKADTKLLIRAYEVAESAHRGQYRKSGDPYITHPLAVATILADLGMDSVTLVAGLLHDTVEDTDYSLDDLTRDFGAEVARLVDGVTKLDKVKYGQAAEAETIRKMIIAMASDPRVLVIKLADRLHNMRTMRFLPPEKQQRKARETLEVLAPLAHRLGMATVKWELEDLSFAILHAKRYNEIARLVADRAPSRESYLASVTDMIRTELTSAKISAEVVGRGKHYYSIYQKMKVRGREFDEIHDLVAVRILVGTVRECYAAMGVVHAMWAPMPGRFKDYIAQPRYGVYQSLHTTVIGPEGKPLEVQIRTHDMHHTAEYGIAAHWRYKETRGTHSGSLTSVDEMAWMRQLLDWQREADDPSEFLDNLRYEIRSNDIFVFTPKGEIHTLPAGSTPVDFAYSIHTEVGHRCIGAKVDGRLVALERKLANGQIVEIFTSKAPDAGPSQDWLNFVASSRAKNKIRHYFAKERREEALESGKDAIAKAARRQGLSVQRLITQDVLTSVARDLGLRDISALYTAVGEGHVNAKTVITKVATAVGGGDSLGDEVAEPTTSLGTSRRSRVTGDVGVLVAGVTDVTIKLARCCTPVPGDAILGFVTKGGAISIHRTDCTNAESLRAEPSRLVDVAWDPNASSVYLVSIQVEALDRHRLLSDITKTLADEKVNLLSANMSMSKEGMAITRFSFEMADPKFLGHVLRAVRGVEGVYDVYRVTTG